MRWVPFRRRSAPKRRPYHLTFEELELRRLLASLQFGAAAYSAGETAGLAVIDVRLVGAGPEPVAVVYQTSDGTAVAGIDYRSASGTMTFPPGATEQTFVVPFLDPGNPGA
jgi:hypothetical protein